MTLREESPSDVLARIPALRERLAASASGYVRVIKFGVPSRTALAVMIEDGDVEIFRSVLGPAYRLRRDSEERDG